MSEEERPAEEAQNSQAMDSIRESSALAALDGLGGSTDSFIEELSQDETFSFGDDSQETVSEAPQGEEQSITTEEVTTEQDSTEQAAETTAEGVTIESEIFGSETFGEETVAEKPTGEISEKISEYFKANDFGINEENFSERVPQLVEKEKEFDKVSGQVKQYADIFNSIPLELHEAMKSFLNNESDWDRHVKERISLDLTKDFASLDSKDVVSKYFPNEISEDYWEEYNDPDGDEGIKRLVTNYINISKGKFESDKASYGNRIEEAKNSSKIYEAKSQESFDNSRGRLEEVFKDKMPSKVYLDTIDQEIKQGMINDLYYDANGLLKPDAHANYIFARDGRDLVNKQREALKRAIASKERTDILERTTDSQRVVKTDSTVSSSDKEREREIKNAVDALLPGGNDVVF